MNVLLLAFLIPLIPDVFLRLGELRGIVLLGELEPSVRVVVVNVKLDISSQDRLVNEGEVNEVVEEKEVVLPVFCPCRIMDTIRRSSQERKEVNVARRSISPLQLHEIGLFPKSSIRDIKHSDFTLTTVLYLLHWQSITFSMDDGDVCEGEEV